MDMSVFNVQVPRNENRSHRLNTPLRAMVEIAGDQAAQATNDKAGARRSTWPVHSIGMVSPDHASLHASAARLYRCRLHAL